VRNNPLIDASVTAAQHPDPPVLRLGRRAPVIGRSTITKYSIDQHP
jgi:hypothetical protein